MFEFADSLVDSLAHSPAGSSATASAVPPPAYALDEQVPFRLREHVRRLKRIVPVISVSVLALRAQNADLDGDVAEVLHHQASQPLDLEIEELEALLESLVARRARHRS
jgi:hypothetical protein